MPTPEEASAALAILIDADNANPAIVKGLIDEVAKFGIDTENKVEDDLHTELSSYLHESDHYRHVCPALKEAPILGEFEDMDEAREYASGNPPCKLGG